MSQNAGPPPVEQSRAVAQSNQQVRQNVAQTNYLTIVETLKTNNGAEAKAIRAMFGGDKRLADKFLAVAFSLLASDSDLLFRATPMSIIQSIKDAASLGLEPMTSDGAIVRYADQAKFMPMYRGYVKRILRSGSIIAVDAKAVMTEDEFDFWTTSRGTEFRHHPAKSLKDSDGTYLASRGVYRGFYAYAVNRDGFCYFTYMDVDAINHVRDTYGSVQTSSGKPLPWATAYDQMALKTVIRQLQKLLPQESVAQLEMVEQKNDDALLEMRAAVGQLTDGMQEVRDLALRAVGQIGPGETALDDPGQETDEKSGDGTGPPTDDGGAATPVVQGPAPEEGGPGATAEPETREEVLAAVAADPGADPNLQAAMALSAEQEQLARHRRK